MHTQSQGYGQRGVKLLKRKSFEGGKKAPKYHSPYELWAYKTFWRWSKVQEKVRKVWGI